MEGHWKFIGEGGFLKAKFLEAMHENTMEFPGGWRGAQTKKTLCGGSMDIFWNCTLPDCTIYVDFFLLKTLEIYFNYQFYK